MSECHHKAIDNNNINTKASGLRFFIRESTVCENVPRTVESRYFENRTHDRGSRENNPLESTEIQPKSHTRCVASILVATQIGRGAPHIPERIRPTPYYFASTIRLYPPRNRTARSGAIPKQSLLGALAILCTIRLPNSIQRGV